MAYKSKFTGEQVDDLLTRIEDGEFNITIDSELSTTSSNPIANSAVTVTIDALTTAVGERVESTTFEQYKAEQVEALDGKQDTLTLTMLSNGNIRIGNLAGQTKDFMPATPSGDPMHYVYEDAGAVWNATTQLWEVAGVSNLTTNEIRAIYPTRTMWAATTDGLFNGYKYRVIFTPINNQIGGLAGATATAKAMCMYARQLEVFSKSNFYPQNANYIFYQCLAIHTILLNGSQCNSWNASFTGCTALVNVNIMGVKANISFADSPNLSKESILYMIENAGDATFTITLHATAYAMAMADADILAALANKTNVTLASA